ncbi:MAG: hypothetical protein JWO19_3950 [Bryobacterales bacterium]|jgi:hypothetical protein|nr:hypothetical protein [Bryobacterales bacterium]
MMDFLSRLEQLQFSRWVLESGTIWAYPTILFMHSIGMALVAGFNAVIDLRLLGFSPKTPVRPLERLYPLMWWGFAINAVTGTTLLIADATTKLTNPDFYVKMVFVFSGVAVLAIMRKKVFRDPQLDQGPISGTAKGLAWLSLICWIGAVTAGRLLAYVGPVSGLPGLKNR